MHKAIWVLAAVLALGLTSCEDNTTAPRVLSPPAAPRGLYSTTGDESVTLRWLANTEPAISGYRIYQSTCATACPYDRVGTTTATSFVISGLANGVTRFFAVAAVDVNGNESPLSYETVYDTPRPAGVGAAMVNLRGGPGGTGWDFSAMLARPWTNAQVDVFYSDTLGFGGIYAADLSTDIQDVGYHSSLDAVDFAPATGWSPTGSVEAIVGHCYVVWTRDDHYAKFRVTAAGTNAVTFDWAYQTDPANGELSAQPVGRGGARARQAFVSQR